MAIIGDHIAFLTQLSYLVAQVILTLAFIWLFMYVFDRKLGSRFRKHTMKTGHALVYVLMAAVLLFESFIRHGQPDFVFLAIEAVILLVYALAFCKGTILHKVFWLFIMAVFFAASSIASSLFLQILQEQSMLPLVLDERAQAVLLLLFAYIPFALVGATFVKQRQHATEMSPVAMLIMALVPVMSCIIIFFWSYGGFFDHFTIAETALQGSTTVLKLMAVLAVAVINFVVFVLYDYMLTKGEETFEQKSLLEQAQISKTHYDELRVLYQETRTWRHDYANHLQAIEGYAVARDFDALEKYLAELKGAADKMSFRTHSGNDLLDAILNTKIAHAESLGISFTADFGVSMSDVPLSAVDCTSLIGNLVDNAIEACQKIIDTDADRTIELHISRTRDQLTIFQRNTMQGLIAQSQQGSFASTKAKTEGDHGIGTRQIASLVRKYRGNIDHVIDKGMFEVYISIPI